MEFKLPIEVKRELLAEILKLDNPFNLNEDYNYPDFLSEILPLKDLPSEDSRFDNAFDDAYKHLVLNDDWDDEFIFNERFKIVSNDDLFKSFIEKTLNRTSEENKGELLKSIKKYLNANNFDIKQEYDNSFNTLYSVDNLNGARFNYEVPENNIPFFVGKYFELPSNVFPYFVLEPDSWDDYGYRTRFDLTFFESEKNYFALGKIRILKRNNVLTVDAIDKTFKNLNNEFCSLFNFEWSYLELKEKFPKSYKSIFAALNDAAYFPAIYDEFNREEGFKDSLCRNEKEAEKILRTIRHKLEYTDIKYFFDFNYKFNPLYAPDSVNFKFEFRLDKLIPKRLYCIIGKNGVGKTQFIRNLLLDLSNKNNENISPKIPLFGKIIMVSFSYFDIFEDIHSRVEFNFVYCGLINPKSGKPLGNDELIVEINKSIREIIRKEDERKYFIVCSKFLDSETIRALFKNGDDEINNESISPIIDKMSSGQKVLFFLVTKIISNISYNSFLIFDEPETHLHPNAITEFMNVIMELLQEYDSYGLIATHSPLIVREIFSDSIFVLERDRDIPRVRKLEFETFGESLSTITEEIFGNRDVPKYFIESIKELVWQGKSYQPEFD